MFRKQKFTVKVNFLPGVLFAWPRNANVEYLHMSPQTRFADNRNIILDFLGDGGLIFKREWNVAVIICLTSVSLGFTKMVNKPLLRPR